MKKMTDREMDYFLLGVIWGIILFNTVVFLAYYLIGKL